MLAKRVGEIPAGPGWIFEPKWDGFRVLVFRDGDEILLQSRDEKPLDRYFPDLARAAARPQLPTRCVLDGEIVIATARGLDFEALQLRLHPAASRVKMLAEELPASVVFWDLLCEGDRDLRVRAVSTSGAPRSRRLLAQATPPIHLTPATTDRGVAADWFTRFEGAGLDGVMAKPDAGPYEPNKRVMLKVKHERECDCVVAGFRWHKAGAGTAVGSLLLGLYDEAGALHHVGVCASFTAAEAAGARRVPRAVPRERARVSPVEGMGRRTGPGRSDAARACPAGRAAGARARTSRGSRCAPSWWSRWPTTTCRGRASVTPRSSGDGGPTRSSRDCTYAQLEVVAPHELAAIFATGR